MKTPQKKGAPAAPRTARTTPVAKAAPAKTAPAGKAAPAKKPMASKGTTDGKRAPKR